ncbi:MAG: hypothetical protein ACR2G0_07800 [Chthoniobacterales bacterium]
MSIPSLLGATRSWLRQTRCKWLLVLTLLCLVLGENYPFSNFPMYSSFSQRTYYLYLVDARGEAIRTREFGLGSSTLKKIFDRARREELPHFANAGEARVPLAEQAAARSLLTYLDGLAMKKRTARKLLPGLEVRHVLVHQKEGVLALDTRTLARHP